MPQTDDSEARPVIRPMRDEDLAPLADLWVESWREAMPAIDFSARWAWIAAILSDPSTEKLVVDTGGAPRGFAVLEGAVLSQFVVASAVKGGGLAKLLMAEAKRRRPLGLDLEVNNDNARAVRFYEREGFAKTGEGRNAKSGLGTWRMRWSP